MSRPLYLLLGVKDDATADEIRKAFRRLSKTAHPDAGGSREHFERLKFAEKLLCDENRRRVYDATGEETPVTPDNLQSQAYAIISGMLDQVVGSVLQQGHDIKQVDIVATMNDQLRSWRAEIEKQCAGVEKTMAALESIQRRFRPRKKDGPNPVGDMIAPKLVIMKMDLERRRATLADYDRAATIMEDQDYEQFRRTMVGGMGMFAGLVS